MLYVVIWHPKGKRPETYSQWGKEDAQSLINFYDLPKAKQPFSTRTETR